MSGWTAIAAPPATHVEIAVLGDGSTAVVETSTREPIQYVRSPEAAKGILARWQAFFASPRRGGT